MHINELVDFVLSACRMRYCVMLTTNDLTPKGFMQ